VLLGCLSLGGIILPGRIAGRSLRLLHGLIFPT